MAQKNDKLASISVRNIDPKVAEALKRRAADNERSVEAEVRHMIGQATKAYMD